MLNQNEKEPSNKEDSPSLISSVVKGLTLTILYLLITIFFGNLKII